MKAPADSAAISSESAGGHAPIRILLSDAFRRNAGLGRVALHAAGLMGGRVVWLRHAPAGIESNDRTLHEAAVILAQHCCARNPALCDLDFVADAVRDWAGRPMLATYHDHAVRLGCTRAHLLYHYRFSYSAPAVVEILEAAYSTALARIEKALDRARVVWR